MIESAEVNAIGNVPDDQDSVQISMASIAVRPIPVSNEQPIYLCPPPPTHLSPRNCVGLGNDDGDVKKVQGIGSKQKPAEGEPCSELLYSCIS